MASYCIVRSNSIQKNGKDTFLADSSDSSDFFWEAYQGMAMSYPKFHRMDKFCQLGILCAEPLLTGQEITAEDTAVLLASSSGSSHIDTSYHQAVFAQENIHFSPAQFTYTLPSAILGELCIKHHIKGENFFFLQAEFDFSLLRDYAKDLFVQQQASACLLGWMDYWSETDYLASFLWLRANEVDNMDSFISQINKTCIDYGKASIS